MITGILDLLGMVTSNLSLTGETGPSAKREPLEILQEYEYCFNPSAREIAFSLPAGRSFTDLWTACNQAGADGLVVDPGFLKKNTHPQYNVRPDKEIEFNAAFTLAPSEQDVLPQDTKFTFRVTPIIVSTFGHTRTDQMALISAEDLAPGQTRTVLSALALHLLATGEDPLKGRQLRVEASGTLIAKEPRGYTILYTYGSDSDGAEPSVGFAGQETR